MPWSYLLLGTKIGLYGPLVLVFSNDITWRCILLQVGCLNDFLVDQIEQLFSARLTYHGTVAAESRSGMKLSVLSSVVP